VAKAAQKLAFVASRDPAAQAGVRALQARYDCVDPDAADVIVALGGDGFMLSTLHDTQDLASSVYGMNRGTVGFLMNEYSEDHLLERIAAAECAVINPLRMTAKRSDGYIEEALAINEVSLLRSCAHGRGGVSTTALARRIAAKACGCAL